MNVSMCVKQGEEEKSLGLAISPYMDRTTPQVAKLQESFIRGLVGTLSTAYASAGLMPGVLKPNYSEENDDTQESKHHMLELSISFVPPTYRFNNQNKDEQEVTDGKKVVSYSLYCELLANYKKNYDMWCERLKQEQAANQ